MRRREAVSEGAVAGLAGLKSEVATKPLSSCPGTRPQNASQGHVYMHPEASDALRMRCFVGNLPAGRLINEAGVVRVLDISLVDDREASFDPPGQAGYAGGIGCGKLDR